jgi:hypothetical protein
MIVSLPKGCIGRSKEKWRPFKRIAVRAGGDWPDIVDRLIEKSIAEDEAEREAGLKAQPPGMVLLTDLYKVWGDDEKFVPTLDLVPRLIEHNPDYWGTDSPYGKPLTETRFGRLMAQAAKLTSHRVGGVAPRGYLRSQLEPVWHRLGISPRKKPGEPDGSGEPDGDGPGAPSGSSGSSGPSGSYGGPEGYDSCLDCGRDLTGVWDLPVVRIRGYCTPCWNKQQRRSG